MLGDEHRSNLLEAMSFGSFAARFADEKSRFAWCCSDPEVVREYEENPLCGFTFSDDAFFALNDLLKETYGFHGWHCTNRKLPVLFLSGGDDPCYVNVRRFKKSIDHMRLIGYRNVRGKLYPGMRHEILNEKEKYRVYGDVWKWLKKEKVVENVEGEAHLRRPRTAFRQGAAVFDHFLKKTLISKKTDERFSMKVNF